MRKRRSKKGIRSNRKKVKVSKKGKKKSKRSVKKGGFIVDGKKPSCGGKRSKKSKKSKTSSNNGSSNERLNDPTLKALCMRCFHSSGKKTKSCSMKLNGRTSDVTSRGRSMIRGICSECDGKMVVFV